MTAEQQIIEAIQNCTMSYGKSSLGDDDNEVNNYQEIDHAINLVKQFFKEIVLHKKLANTDFNNCNYPPEKRFYAAGAKNQCNQLLYMELTDDTK